MLDAFNKVLDVIDIISLMTYFTYVLMPKFKNKYRPFFALTSATAIITINWVIETTLSIQGLSFELRVSTVLEVSVILVYIFLFFKDSFGKKCLQVAIVFATVFITDACGTVLVWKIYNLEQVVDSITPAGHLFGHTFYIIVTIFIFLLFFFKFKKSEFNVNKQQGIILMLFVFVEIFMIMNTVYVHSSYISNPLLMSLLIEIATCVVIDIVVVFSMKRMAQMIDEENLIFVEKFNATHIEEIKAENERFRSLRNEILATIQNTKKCINENENKTAKELLANFNYDVDNSETKKYCENHLVNSILNLKQKEANEINITINPNVYCPNNISIESYDLCNIFCNIIDNAIDYCDIKANSVITLSAKQVANQYIIKCDNAYSKSKKEKNRTSQKKHGFGLKIVSKLCKKYNGTVSMSKSNNIFSILAHISF